MNSPKHRNGGRRSTKLLGGYVPDSLFRAIQVWISRSPERSVSTFVRDASREKLKRDGIKFVE